MICCAEGMRRLTRNLWYLVMLLALGVIAALSGCTMGKSVDTTKMIDYATRSDSNVKYTILPGPQVGLPEGTIAIPTVPGKNVTYEEYYPDGTLHRKLMTSRSVVLDALIAGVDKVEAGKIADRAAQREWTMDLVRLFIEVAMPIVQQQLNKPEPSPSTQPNARDRAVEEVLLRLPGILDRLEGKLAQPAGGTP